MSHKWRIKYTNKFAKSLDRYYMEGKKDCPAGKIFDDSTKAVLVADMLNTAVRKFKVYGGEYKAEVYNV